MSQEGRKRTAARVLFVFGVVRVALGDSFAHGDFCMVGMCPLKVPQNKCQNWLLGLRL